MWSVFGKVNNNNTLASLRVKISEVMADMDRDVVIRSFKKFWSGIEAVVGTSGYFIK
jgi:hypothetical protein